MVAHADPAAKWRSRFGSILDPDARDPQHTVDVPGDEGLAALGRRLRKIYAERTEVDRIMVRVDDIDIDIATRASVGADRGTAAVVPTEVGPGAGDGATLPGLPGEFRAVRFACTKCAGTFVRTFYDARRLPACPDHGATTEYRP